MKELYPYTPRKTNHGRLERYFVARNDLLEELLASLRQQAKAKSLQHWMILGSRGLGKSHLAALLYHRIKNTPALQAKWTPLLMDEEEPEVFSLPTLLARIVAVLGEELRAVAPEKANEVLNFLDHLRQATLSPDHLYEDIIAYLKDFTNLNKKRIVVFLENTDDLFTKSIKSDLEIKKLRHLLLQHNFLLFIATSPTFFERIGKQKEPLYGLFRLRHLELLDFEQSMDLMCRWAEEAKNGEMLARLRRPDFRIRVLNHLTGGNPRLLLFLYLTLSSQKEMESAAEAFGKLLEHDLTGFYLSRMRDIPEQAKPIVVALAKSRINLTQKEIAERTFLPIRSMGTHINRLEKSGLVRAFTKKAGKNTLYGLTDHLFRLWHQWRTGWREREVIQALVEFLAIWYRERELVSLAGGKGMAAWYARQALEYRHEEEFQSRLELVQKEGMADLTEHLQKGDYQGIFHLVESLSDFGLDLEPWIEELEKEMFYRGPKESHLKLLAQWENQEIEIAEKPQEGDRKKRLLKRIKQLRALVEIAKGRPIVQIHVREFEDGELVNLVGQFKLKAKDYSDAEEAYQRAVELAPDYSAAWNNLGVARGGQGNYAGAEEACRRAVELAPDDSAAWNNLGVARGGQGNSAGEEEAYQRAVELAPDDSEAWYNLGAVRGRQGNHAGAEEAYQRAVELTPDNSAAWNNLGVALYYQWNFKESKKALVKATEIKPKDINTYANLVEIHVVSQGRLDALKRLDRSLKLKKIEAYVRATLHLFRAIALTSEENKPAAIQALKNGQKWIDKLDPNTQAEQRQSILAALMDSLQDLILPETWKVVNNYLTLMAGSAPKVHEVIGRLEHVVQYYKELEFETGEKAVRRDKAASRAQRILDRLPTEERGPIEEMVKEVATNIKRWRKAPKTARASKKKLNM